MADGEGFFARLANEPSVKQLLSNVGDYATAKGKDLAAKKLPGAEDADGVIEAGKNQAKREAAVPAIKGFFKGAWAKLSGKAKGAKGKRPVNVVETAMIGAPIEMVWDAWLDFDQWPNFMKGPEKVDAPKEQNDADGEPVTNWTAKIFLSRRQWKSTITEQVEYERLRWKSEGSKGTVDGAVSFTPIGENATLVTLVLEYRRKGLFEAIGNTWRAQGRRARLDFKHFQRHISMADQADQLNRPEGDDDQRDDEDRPNGDGLSQRDDERDAARAAERTDATDDTGISEPVGTTEGAGEPGEAGGAGDGRESGAGADQERTATSP